MKSATGRSWRGSLRAAWIVPGVVVAVVGAAVCVRLARRPVSAPELQRQAAAQAATRPAAVAELLARLRQEPDPMAFVQARIGRDDSDALTDLIQAYAAWASRGDALEARRAIVKGFLDNQNLKVGLEALLKAVALDETP